VSLKSAFIPQGSFCGGWVNSTPFPRRSWNVRSTSSATKTIAGVAGSGAPVAAENTSRGLIESRRRHQTDTPEHVVVRPWRRRA
jgi:hypothetical protein